MASEVVQIPTEPPKQQQQDSNALAVNNNNHANGSNNNDQQQPSSSSSNSLDTTSTPGAPGEQPAVVKKRKAPVRKKKPEHQTPPKKKKKSKEELQWAVDCIIDFQKLPQQLTVDQVQDLVTAYGKVPAKKISWENEHWKSVFERCWGLGRIQNDEFDNWQPGYKELAEETNWIVRYPFKMELEDAKTHKVIEASKVDDDEDLDWFIVTSTKLFAAELQESLNLLFPQEKHLTFLTPLLESMKDFNPDRCLTIALGSNFGPQSIRPDSFTKPTLNDKYKKTNLLSIFNAQLKGHKLIEFEGKDKTNLLLWSGVKNGFIVGFYTVRKDEDEDQASENDQDSEEEASDNFDDVSDEDDD